MDGRVVCHPAHRCCPCCAEHHSVRIPLLLLYSKNEGTLHCLSITTPVVTILDQELAGKIAVLDKQLKAAGVGPLFAYEGIGHLGADVGRVVTEIDTSNVDTKLMLDVENGVGIETLGPDDDGMIYFTSG